MGASVSSGAPGNEKTAGALDLGRRLRGLFGDASTRRQGGLLGYWFDPMPQRSMAICRIVFGAIIFVAYAWLIPNYAALHGANGIGGALFRAHVEPPHVISRFSYWHLMWLNGLSNGPLLVLYGALMVSALGFAVGYRTRLSGLVMVVLHTLFQARLQQQFWGWAVMFSPLALYVIASPASRAWSIDARFRGLTAPKSCTAFPLRLLEVHCACVYLTVFSARLGTPYWMDGTALYRILSDRTFSRFPEMGHHIQPLLMVLGSSALALEGIAILLLLRGRVAKLIALGLILMHIGLEVLTMVGWWNAMLIAVLLAFFETEDGFSLWKASPRPPAAQAAVSTGPLPVTLLRYAAALTFTAYAIVLVLGSLRLTPFPRSMRRLAKIARKAADLTEEYGVLPGLALFYDPVDTPVFRRGNCITVEAKGPGGATEVERLPAEHCERRGTFLEIPKFANAAVMLMYDASDLHPDTVKWRLPTRGPTRVAAVAEYFCHGRPRGFVPDTIHLTWQQDMRHIETDKEWRRRMLDATWDCNIHKFTSMEWDFSTGEPVEPDASGEGEEPEASDSAEATSSPSAEPPAEPTAPAEEAPGESTPPER